MVDENPQQPENDSDSEPGGRAACPLGQRPPTMTTTIPDGPRRERSRALAPTTRRCTMDRTLIERYVAGATVPAGAIRGLSTQELNAFPVPGTWSIQQVVLHLMDSDLIGA